MAEEDPYRCEEEYNLEELRQGNEEAFEKIFRHYWHPLYMMAYHKLRSHEEAEEIIQGIFTTLWEKRETLFITNLRYYLFASVRNRIINQVRSKITQEKYWNFYRTSIPQQEAATEDAVLFDDLTEAIEKAVNKLPEKSRQVFKLSRLEGHTITEIANRLHLSDKAIEYHLTKSIKELRMYLKDFILMLLAFFLLK